MIDHAQLKQSLGRLDQNTVDKMLDEFLAAKPSEQDAKETTEAFWQGMTMVESSFGKGEFSLDDQPRANAMLYSAFGRLKPLMNFNAGQAAPRSTIVVGSAEYDSFGIWKSLFSQMAELSGFRVVDIGVALPPAALVEAAMTNKSSIIGLFSSVGTFPAELIKQAVDAFKTAGMRNGIKIIISGNAVTSDDCKCTGADIWTRNPIEAANICNAWVK